MKRQTAPIGQGSTRRGKGPRGAIRWVGSLSVVVLLVVAPGGIRARDYPPAAAPPKPLVLPAPALRVLSNGLKVVVIERHTLPSLTLRLVVKAGAEADPVGFPGTAQFVSNLITEGTSRRTARELAEAIDSVGGVIDNGAEWDNSYVTLSVLSNHELLAFDLVADMVTHPAFRADEIERIRKQTLSGLKVVRDDPSYLADTALRTAVFAGTAYSHPEDGTIEAVGRISASELRQFHQRYYLPSNSVLAIVGDITVNEAFEQAAKWFGAWADGPAPSAASVPALIAAGRRTIVIDKLDAVQTEIRVGNRGAPRASPDFYALSVANQVLGGPAANRLFRALRTRQGLTYGASSDLLCYRNVGAWVAKTSTRTPETLKSLDITLEQMRSLRDHSISDAELDTAKDYLIGHMALDFETSDDMASQFLDLMIHNLPLDYWNRYPDKLRELTRADVGDAMRRYLNPDESVITLVGNVAGFKKGLKKLAPVQVIPVGQLDFSSPDLLRPAAPAGER